MANGGIPIYPRDPPRIRAVIRSTAEADVAKVESLEWLSQDISLGVIHCFTLRLICGAVFQVGLHSRVPGFMS